MRTNAYRVRMSKIKPTNVILDPHTKRWLKSEAKRTRDSVSRVIRLAVHDYRRQIAKEKAR